MSAEVSHARRTKPPTSEVELRLLALRAWTDHGILLVKVDEIRDPLLWQAFVNHGVREYGPRLGVEGRL